MQHWYGLSDPAMEGALYEITSMRQTHKGNQWYFEMKMHIGVADMTGTVHSLVTTAANVNDVTQAHHLLHGEEERGFGDAGHQGVEKCLEHKERQNQWHIALRSGKRRALGTSKADRLTEEIEQSKASMWAIVEHPFRVIKRQFGFTKGRYRGLAKNDNALHTMSALCEL